MTGAVEPSANERLGKEFIEINNEVTGYPLDDADAVQRNGDVIQMRNSTDILE